MTIKIDSTSVVVFDLDDTLYHEEDFLLSGFASIAKHVESEIGIDYLQKLLEWRRDRAEDIFGQLLKEEGVAKCLSKEDLLNLYRFHIPAIKLSRGAKALIDALSKASIRMALITDGRSVTQRNKLQVLGVEKYFDPIVISEELGTGKPDPKNYVAIEERWPDSSYFYIADNTAKDFLTPNARDWTSVCLRDVGRNIHPQRLDLSAEYLPKHLIDSLSDLIPQVT